MPSTAWCWPMASMSIGSICRGGERNTGAICRLRCVLYNRPGTLAEVTGIFAKNHANIVYLEMSQRDELFGTYDVELEVLDLAHLTRIVSSLRASEAVAQADRN